jgi:hypothetical protein
MLPENGVMPVPKPGEKRGGGHQVPCLGHDFSKRMALIPNRRVMVWGDFKTMASPDTDPGIVATLADREFLRLETL